MSAEHKTINKVIRGEGIGAEVQVQCSCGWKSKPIGRWNNWYPTLLSQEALKHREEVRDDRNNR